jgi:long-chain acyl-CoA synthetase
MSPFWALSSDPDACALIADDGTTIDYRRLALLTDSMAAALPDSTGRQLGFIALAPTVALVATYLHALRSKQHVPLLLAPELHTELLAVLVTRYQPHWIALPGHHRDVEGYVEHWAADGEKVLVRDGRRVFEPELYPDLALLLTTSGSTGSSKLVRLSYEALAKNADSIVKYLNLGTNDRAIITLPLSYSYGLSILNSHLAAGASLILSTASVISRRFWQQASTFRPTSLSGVPSTYEMLRRVKLESRGLQNLRMLTQAGGRLRGELVTLFNAMCRNLGWEFYVMYGQTEASPRISYVPPNRLAEKNGSIGIPVPGGKLEVDANTSELIYRGPNVMLGYADSVADLARGDDCQGVLRTGDTARCDEEGFFYLTGRLKRFLKLSGTRVNLDDIEDGLIAHFHHGFACTGEDDALNVFFASDTREISPSEIRTWLRDRFGVFHGQVSVFPIPAFPLLANGKIDYLSLQEQVLASASGAPTRPPVSP